MRSNRAGILGFVLAALLLVGCSGPPAEPEPPRVTETATPDAPTAPAPASVGTVATATVSTVRVHDEPGGVEVSTLENPQPSGAPLTFLVITVQEGWLDVHLPQRPNGSTGWIDASTVTVHSLEYELRVSTERNTLALYRNGGLVETYTVATGTGDTPTPHGAFYLTELIAPTNPGYGPYAFGISAFSDVLTSFGGGPGQIGLHGTDDADSVGQAASHGCIRLSNEDITALAQVLPLGTPITIE